MKPEASREPLQTVRETLLQWGDLVGRFTNVRPNLDVSTNVHHGEVAILYFLDQRDLVTEVVAVTVQSGKDRDRWQVDMIGRQARFLAEEVLAVGPSHPDDIRDALSTFLERHRQAATAEISGGAGSGCRTSRHGVSGG